MNTKLFSLASRYFSRNDFRLFKDELNKASSRYFGRTLNPSNLNEMASMVLGAKDSNTMSSVFKMTSPDIVIKNYMRHLNSVAENHLDKTSLNTQLIPLAEFNIGSEMVSLGAEIFRHDTGSESELIEITAYCNVFEEPKDPESELASLHWNGGDSLTAMLRTVFTSSEPELYDLFKAYGVKKTKPSKAKVSDLMKEVYGFNKSSFSNFSTFEDIEDYLYTCLVTISSDLNMSFSKSGAPMCVKTNKGHLDAYQVRMTK